MRPREPIRPNYERSDTRPSNHPGPDRGSIRSQQIGPNLPTTVLDRERWPDGGLQSGRPSRLFNSPIHSRTSLTCVGGQTVGRHPKASTLTDSGQPQGSAPTESPKNP
ncbi:hypothetical protein PGT21_016919 [Puccinia graminis f. sp. tritici]|uniref:Uncharacterized protein n=1 Tax=Puccinia graminis f. sp. tritici TaxID=56615 RepID=A0A5B0P5Q0_PUCGR|nr:hypothetical protein PGTUg99_007091 [Puccinia graminis f. sp. tritici]KAA1073040.1 hypothetical protein PGTUg99_022814 [Puccinia graminis f. sp. tritici]KAA1084747.1 hypothetical protein PGT21_035048 [Puccinia graminis f. sp. tritici]KAA1094402.1 hypothetical protein PGT21_020262 [Puccinia graminis f. sp. tritici]KAA1096443.1 hypothetical protein PGT21_016919 [Puccinia graminis f. sp. tritici]